MNRLLPLMLAILGAAFAGVMLARKRSQAAGIDDDWSYWTPAPSADPSSPGGVSAAVQRIAVAIAAAEGFSVPGSVPNRNHNPGDLRLDPIGRATGKDSLGFVKYANDSDGWAALQKQVTLMVTNQSRIYNRDMSIADVARRYTATAQDAWASIVAGQLGVSPATKLAELLT